MDKKSLREMQTPDLQSELMVVRSKSESIRHKNQGHGSTPEFWGLAQKETAIVQELDRRKIKTENT